MVGVFFFLNDEEARCLLLGASSCVVKLSFNATAVSPIGFFRGSEEIRTPGTVTRTAV